MKVVFVFSLLLGLSTPYGPPSNTGNGCGGGNGGCGGAQPSPIQAPSCGGGGCGGSTGGGSGSSGSGDYWWAGNNPFAGPPASHVSVGGSPSSGARPVVQQQVPVVQRPRPQQGYVQPSPSQQSATPIQLPSTQNLVQPPMGICPATYVCVHWQLCRNGVVISDGTGNIDKRIKNVPAQVASRYQSCGGDMICCGIPPGTPVSQTQSIAPAAPLRPAPSPLVPAPVAPLRPALAPLQPAPAPLKPAPAPLKPAPAPLKPAPAPLKPVSPPLLVPAPQRPAPAPLRPAPAPQSPALQLSKPASQPSGSLSVPSPSSNGYGRPAVPQNPLTPPRPLTNTQPRPQSSVVNPVGPVPQPSAPVSNPVSLVSPPNQQVNPMMPGMMGMMGMMPMRGGSCSAGTYCVQQNQCNPYTGFIIRDPSQLMAVWPESPTVPLLSCFIPDGSLVDGVCCQEAHPNAGGFD